VGSVQDQRLCRNECRPEILFLQIVKTKTIFRSKIVECTLNLVSKQFQKINCFLVLVLVFSKISFF